MLRLLDPSDAVLDAVATPVRSYLQQRKDTVRCIVTSLTDENADLYNELKEQQSDQMGMGAGATGGDMSDGMAEEEGEGGSGNTIWQPRLRNTDTLFGGPWGDGRGWGGKHGGNKSGGCKGGARPPLATGQFDILGMLISIYGSKELFVKEYRCMLANKLIKNLAYDTAKDLAILERLKLRFGESSMQQCDIMVKDVDESKRLNVTVQGKLAETLEARDLAKGDGGLGNPADFTYPPYRSNWNAICVLSRVI